MHPILYWTENGEARSARWRSESGAPAASRVVIADDHTTADDEYGLVCQGTALLWRGDFQNARQMLLALANRANRRSRKPRTSVTSLKPTSTAQAFHLHRQAQAQRARALGALLVPLDEAYGIPLRRAPDVRQACTEAYGRSRSEVLAAFDAAELRVVDRSDVRPEHLRASDETDFLHAARAAEVTSLWRLAAR